jgi:CBS domain-containing protein
MQAKEIMSRNVECISPETTIMEASQKMKSLDVGFLPVCEGDRLAGTVTDRDIVLRVVTAGKDVRTCKARDIMTDNVVWCFEDMAADEIGEIMADKEIRRVLVLSRDKRLVGVISIGDLAKARGEQKNAGETIKQIAEAPRQAA